MTKNTSKRVGNAGEALTLSVLHGLGIEQPREIATPHTMTPYRDPRTRRVVPGVYYVKQNKKVVGDIRGILGETGISVLTEVKTYTSDDRLIYSKLDDHQHADLLEHDRLGGVSLLAWVHGYGSSGVAIMKYPIEGFVPRSSIPLYRAYELDDSTRAWIQWAIENVSSPWAFPGNSN